MKMRLLSLFVAVACAAPLLAEGSAADATGTWKWRLGAFGREVESTLVLTLEDGRLAGTVDNLAGKVPVQDLVCDRHEIGFTVQREILGRIFVAKYRGTLDGDVIKGTVETTGAGPETSRNTLIGDWDATRAR